ncbi:MAG: 50S ribosomal protein L17 [Treponemataceae bacterium]|nr:50S ribosomal protein L17 [Treponemataceae bacterium]
MNHKIGFNPLSRTTAHRRAMSRNMVTSLFRYERITTTKAKALEVRKAAEKLITRAKEDTVHNRRIAAKFIQDEIVLAKLFKDIGPRMKDRNGGYTRVLKIGYRQGDAADMVILELVDYKLSDGKKEEKKEPAKAKKESKETSAKKAPAKKSTAKKTTAKKAAEEAAPAEAKTEE